MENDIGCSMLFSPLPARECRPFIAAALLCTLGTATAHAQVTENVLYNFTGGSDGASPGYLRADTSGPGGALRALYGVGTDCGNQNANCPAVGPDPSGCGTVFKLTPPPQGQGTWSESTLWDFTSGKDGENPQSALVASTNRINGTTNLYGTTLGSFAYSGQGD